MIPTLSSNTTWVNPHTGNEQPVTLLNNAASTPPFAETLQTVVDAMKTYGALHRGAGPHASATYAAWMRSIGTIRTFLNMRESDALLFTANTSGAINLFARMLHLSANDVVMTSSIEHTSNNLPWKYNTNAQIVEIRAFDDGSLDMDHAHQLANRYGKHVKLVTITGASNQTGYIPDIRALSHLAHECNALLFVDAAQLAPHRPIDMQRDGIDALAFSAHKMYAPFGIGVLVLPERFLDELPVDPGGGSIDMISENSIIWAPPRVRHQTGTWNVAGILALSKSCEILTHSWHEILDHEKS